jgi:protein-S-isoprenylcysteine O-methyltransferase Ste14
VQRTAAVFGSFLFLLIAPGCAAGLGPWLITRWHFQSPWFGFAPFRAVGVALMVVGTPMVLDSFARFALHGFGTPAPIAPPTRLVITGLYRYVRNPMYVGVEIVVLGEALLFGAVALLIYGAVLFAGFSAFVLLYEEPKLRTTFGEDYVRFCRNVPRWIPRIHGWRT